MKHTNKFVAAMLMFGAVAGTSCFVQVNASDEVDAKAVLNANVSLTGALDIALQIVPGTPIAVELEREDGVVLWDVEILNNNQQIIEFEIDATSGAVLKQHIEDDEEDD